MKPPITNGRDLHPATSDQFSLKDTLVQDTSLHTVPLQSSASQSDEPRRYNPPEVDLSDPVATGNSLLTNLVYLFAGGLIAAIAAFTMGSSKSTALEIQPPPTVAPTATPAPTATTAPIKVYVTGAVINPGLYEVKLDGRVGDVIQLAGGLLGEADPALINQAGLLYDGAQIHVPLPAPTTDGSREVVAAPSLLINQPPAGISGAPASTLLLANPSRGGLISINSASAAELETLPGVGASRAQEIIAGRPYSTIDDLEKVSGIGAKTVEKLRPLVTVD